MQIQDTILLYRPHKAALGSKSSSHTSDERAFSGRRHWGVAQRAPICVFTIPSTTVNTAATPTSKSTPSPHTVDWTLSRHHEGRSPSSSSPLTPAGAVAEAYKRQEQERSCQTSKGSSSNSRSGSGSGRDDTPKIPTPLLSDLNSPMRLWLRLGLYRLPRRRRPPRLRRILRSWAVLRGASWLSAVRTGIMWMDTIIIGS